MRLLLTTICFLTSLLTQGAGLFFHPNVELAYRDALKGQVASARQHLVDVPNHPQLVLVANYIDFVDLMLIEDETKYKQLKGNQLLRDAALSELPIDKTWHPYARATLTWQWAVINGKYQQSIGAALAFRSAYKQLEDLRKEQPKFLPAATTFGLMKVVLSQVPEQYQWMLSLVGVDGNLKDGLSLLKRSDLPSNPMQEEARIYRVVLPTLLQEGEDIMDYGITNMAANQPDHLVLATMFSFYCRRASKGPALAEFLKKAESVNSMKKLPYLQYVAAENWFQQCQWARAKGYYDQFLHQTPSQNLKKDACYKLAICRMMLGEGKRAALTRDSVTLIGATLYDPDKVAQKAAQSREWPFMPIYQLRLATDGGFINLGKQYSRELLEKECPTSKDKAEFWYRQARLAHKQRLMAQATSFYAKCVDMSKDKPWYFAPNACLLMGNYYLKDKQYKRAKEWLEKVSKFDDYPYQKSIEHRTKKALRQIPS